nr:DUF6153 family protein [Streptomyces smaragdinus]
MTFAVRFPRRRPGGRWLVVLALVAGVLGMHGLAVGPVSAAHAGEGHAVVMGHEAAAACPYVTGDAGRVHHADGTCAAAGVGSPYTPPALRGALDPPAVPVAGVRGEGTTDVWGRAPPDLAELQLLRI